jgi:tRNA wybutosine-synthesizing protein 3
MQTQFPHLRPDHADTAGDVLPSFAGIRGKTLETLYPDSFAAHHRADKSPKGSVDHPIQELVDLINAHPSFSTLSSCSGRISLFDHGVKAVKDDSVTNDENDTTEQDRAESGKGGSGGWLLVSHDEIEAEELLRVFREKGETTTALTDESNKSCSILSFKLEPMLMHVAAATLQRGQQLLQLALRLGFRESGLIVTASRITVAIRGYGLTLSVPLALQGPLRTSEEYLVALVGEANRRLRTNITRIQRVYDEVELDLFRPVQSCGRIRARPLPDLNLWGHAAVSVSKRNEKGDVDLLVFGGYGRGPSVVVSGCVKEASKASRRSDKIYCLRRSSGAWDSHWHQVDQDLQPDAANAHEESSSELGVTVRNAAFTAREGAAACVVSGTSLVCIFGGRRGPAQPLDELFFYAYPDRHFQQPVDVRGSPPLACWGHSLTALSPDDGNIAVLVGGRNETAGLDSVYVLSTVGNDLGSKHLLWESIVLTSPIRPIFHHSAIVVEGSIFIFGGLSNPIDLLEPFSEEMEDSIFSFKVSSSTTETVYVESVPPHFGQASCALLASDSSNVSHSTILLTGGLPISSDSDTRSDDPVQWLNYSRKKNEWHLSPQRIELEPTSSGGLGPLIHHACVPVPSLSSDKLECVLVGGGASGFAFSQCFAGSHHLELSVSYATESAVVENSTVSPAHTSTRQEKAPLSKQAKDATTLVVFVTKANAKSLKTLLEESSLLDKTYRMTAADASAPLPDPSLYIAVPVTKQCTDQLESLREGQAIPDFPSWMRLVEATGEQQVPYSSASFARQK